MTRRAKLLLAGLLLLVPALAWAGHAAATADCSGDCCPGACCPGPCCSADAG